MKLKVCVRCGGGQNQYTIIKCVIALGLSSFLVYCNIMYGSTYYIDKSQLIEVFLSRAKSNKLELFIMSPATTLPNGDLDMTSLNQLNIVTLGTNGSEKIQKDVLNVFQEDDFEMLILYVHRSIRLPSKFPSNGTFPSHVFYYQKISDLLLHLVIFYERGDNFIWSDSINLNHRNTPEWLNSKNIAYGEYGASFKSIKTKVVLVSVVFRNKVLKVNILKNLDNFGKNVRTSRHIECNYTRAKEFYNTHKQRKSKEWSQSAMNILKTTEEVLTAIGVRFVMSSGTLLGWYRQCGIIPHTTDIDIEILRTEYSDDILKAFIEAGFSHGHTFGTLDEGYEFAVHKYGIKMDIFFVYEDETNYWYGGIKDGRKLRYTLPKYEMCWTDLLKVRLRVPCNTKSYIEAMYGSEWFKSISVWEWATSPKNYKFV